MADHSRRWPRVELALSVTLRAADLEEAAMTLNVSREGIFVRTSTPRPVGTAVTLTIALATGERFQAAGVVVHINPDPDEAVPAHPDLPAGMGIFLNTTTPAWHDFCDQAERTRQAAADRPPPLPPRSGRRTRSS